jgi:HAD superfamily hydrolase (TIGR01509 family)
MLAAGGPAAVLWDLDGTLVDGEPLWQEAAAEILARHGRTLGAATRAALVGADLDTTVRIVLAATGRPVTPRRIRSVRAGLVRAVAARYAAGVPWMPGAFDALVAVQAAGTPMALVTNTVRAIADHALDAIGRHWFDAVVCGDDVPAGKPAPDPYLRAAGLLRVDPTDCVAVEDSAAGTLAAVRAGAAVLVVSDDASVPLGPGRTFRPGLVGLTVAELDAVSCVPSGG